MITCLMKYHFVTSHHFSLRRLRQKDTSKYHIQLSLANLLMLILAFMVIALSAENVTVLYGGCVTVSVLVHYFTLVAVMWMGAEALLMFQKLVIVFSRITKKFIFSISVICWSEFSFSHAKKATFLVCSACTSLAAVPIVLVAIPLIVDLATGHDITSDIIMRRAKLNTTGVISL